MRTMSLFIAALIALIISRGSTPPPSVDSSAGGAGGSSTDGSGGEGPECPADTEDLCNYHCGGWPTPRPNGCLCVLECQPPSSPCVYPGCTGVDLPAKGGSCVEIQRATGFWCAGGVGTCDAAGTCVLPGGVCDPLPSSPPIVCNISNVDCDDGDPCTKDLCLGAWCDNQPLVDGTPCGAGKTCHAGACCAP